MKKERLHITTTKLSLAAGVLYGIADRETSTTMKESLSDVAEFLLSTIEDMIEEGEKGGRKTK